MRECKHCGIEFKPWPGKPGLINECLECCEGDIILYVAEEGNSDDGSVEFMTKNPITIGYIKERELLF